MLKQENNGYWKKYPLSFHDIVDTIFIFHLSKQNKTVVKREREET